MDEFTLHKSHTVTLLPRDPRAFIEVASRELNKIPKSWASVKVYSYPYKESELIVSTQKHLTKTDYWVARRSVHEVSDEFYAKFLKHYIGTSIKDDLLGTYSIPEPYLHTQNECEYIPELISFEKIPLESLPGYEEVANKDHLSRWTCVHLIYKFSPVLKPRHFYQFVMNVEPGFFDDAAYIVQLVCDYPPQGIVAKYSSLERVSYDDGKMKWEMCTTSDSGGWIPKLVQNSVIAKKIAHDVPSVFGWLESKDDP